MSLSPADLFSKLQALPETPCYWVAYSGGLDSHVLLHAMAQIRDQLKGSLRAVHIDHGLQPEAETWLQHATEQSRLLGIKLTTLKLELKPIKGESLEATAREARYQAMRSLISANEMVVTAQHQNDQAETLLLQLMRGSGPSGLASMPESAPFGDGLLARPLLNFTRTELAAYAKQHSLNWVEDSSNSDLRFDRNFIRHQLMPLIKQRWPACNTTLSRSARHCAEAQQLINQLAMADLQQLESKNIATLSVTGLKQLPPPRCRAALRYWIEEQGFQLPSTKKLDRIMDEVLSAAEDRTPLVVWPGVEIRRFRDQLFALKPLAKHNATIRIPWLQGRQLQLPEGLGQLHIEQATEDAINPDLWQQGEIEIRFRQGGERCQYQNETITRSLKRVFQERLKTPPWLRDRVPLIYIDGELAAVADYFVCKPFTATGQPGIKLRWEADASIADYLPK